MWTGSGWVQKVDLPMYWYVPVVCRIVTGYLALPILLKPVVDKYPHPTMLFLQFVCCFVAALPVAVALNQYRIDCAACGPAGRGGPQLGVPGLGGCGVHGRANPAPNGGEVVNGCPAYQQSSIGARQRLCDDARGLAGERRSPWQTARQIQAIPT